MIFDSVTLVLAIKDKADKINCKNNYRPIALANSHVLSKVLETILLNRLEIVLTTDNQYCFKQKHCINMTIYALKHVKEAVLK